MSYHYIISCLPACKILYTDLRTVARIAALFPLLVLFLLALDETKWNGPLNLSRHATSWAIECSPDPVDNRSRSVRCIVSPANRIYLCQPRWFTGSARSIRVQSLTDTLLSLVLPQERGYGKVLARQLFAEGVAYQLGTQLIVAVSHTATLRDFCQRSMYSTMPVVDNTRVYTALSRAPSGKLSLNETRS
ncbi:hypothetical protein DAEQUDRAFT_78758 [Daedalea quercina L-15889]|uniref:Uncharacterized protein n=1 Tax=Daedalea quercina L-15889 TaxID=1314783 RepID=A0A165SGB2_9APHY|nr:hypothetical protein DAEQUDRAFT_78758 [Daedalea quercina L-15889]